MDNAQVGRGMSVCPMYATAWCGHAAWDCARARMSDRHCTWYGTALPLQPKADLKRGLPYGGEQGMDGRLTSRESRRLASRRVVL